MTKLGGAPWSRQKSMRKRKPTLRAALEAARRAGKGVKSAVVEDGKVTLVPWGASSGQRQ